MVMFVIEDERHAEPQGAYPSFQDAIDELKRRAALPWDEAPNLAPCAGWATCGRSYEVVEYDTAQVPWEELRRIAVLDVSADGVKWQTEFPDHA
jgi:hypothetical protein